MSEATATAVETKEVITAAPKKVVKKAAPKKAAKKAAPTKTAKKAAESKAAKGIPDQANKDIRWTPNKLALLAAFKACNALTAATAVTAEDLAKKSKGKLTEKQVRHQVKPHFDLVVQSIVGRTDREDSNIIFYLTAKGQKVKTDE